MKISVIGNAGGGKTTLSRQLAMLHQIPATHVDAIQFVAGMKIRPHAESIEALRKIQNQESWIIDGYGPLDILQERLQASDKIIFIDFPIWRHYWWCTKRQIANLRRRQREELPEGCDEASLEQTLKLYKTLWQVHTKMRPELRRILSREHFKSKTRHVSNIRDWNEIFKKGL
jgi:adenylate kinase family enzyme